MSELSHREKYHPSGRVGWVRFLPWSALALVVSAALGGLLHLAYAHGIYIIIIAPVVAGAVAAGVVHLVVRFGHCRNPWIGGLLGLVAGMVVFLSYYHTGLISLMGVQNAHRVDVLPRYIHLRLQFDVVQDVGKPANPQGGQGGIWHNGFLFLLELGILCGMTTAAGIQRTKIPYSEVSGRWMREQRGLFHSGVGEALVGALETGTLVDWVTARPESISIAVPNSTIIVHYDPVLSVIDTEGPVYLTVTETRVVQIGRILKKNTPKAQTLLDRVQLTPEEVVTLIPIFPALKALLPDMPSPPTASSATGATVRIEPVPDAFTGRILSGHRTVQKLFLVLLLGWLAAIPGLMLGGLILGICEVHIGPISHTVVAIGCIALGIVGLVLVVKFAFRITNLLSRILHRRACREVLSRPDPIVDPEDPTAIFVEVVPRSHWAKANRMLETASDVGFLRLDSARGMLLFEGDKERYWVPAGAILSCEVEQVEPASGMAHTDHYPHFMAVVRANHHDGNWEAPLSVRYDPHSSFRGKSYRARADELQERILELMHGLPGSV